MDTPSTFDNSPKNKRLGFWRNLPLARKLLMAFGALFVFALIIAAVTLDGLNRTQVAYQDTLTHGIEIRRLSDQLSVSLLQARLNEKSSILHWREQGLDTAFANYVTSHAQNVTNMRAQLTQLALFGTVATTVSTGDMTQAQYEADIASLTQNVDAYEKSFTALVEAFKRKGTNKNTDLESEFRIAASNIEARINGQSNLVRLELTLIGMRRSERYYLDQGKQLHVVELQTLVSQLKDQIAETDQLEPAVKTGLLTQLDAYLTAFDALVVLDKEIAAQNKELSNTALAVESLTAKINTLGKQLAADNINAAQANSAQTFTISITTVLVVLAFSILLAFTLSQQLTRPIILLTNTAQEISTGKFDIQAQVNSGDEIGTLAKTFNIMTGQLRGAFQDLDRHAKELEQRTVELEQITKQSEERADELQTIAEIARYISTEKELERLLPLITQTVSERFGFYHVGIFLLNENKKYAVLRAANSPGGQIMLQRQHKLEVGQVGIVGNVTSTGNPRIALDAGIDAVFFNNPDLPDTRSEMALPLTARGTIIGALDVQSAIPNAFTDKDVSILGLLADQLAIAIDNVRLLDEIQNALNETQSLVHNYLADAWQKKSTSEVMGYHQSLAGGQLLTGGQPGKTIDAAVAKEGALAVPIKLRDQVIGTINIRSNTGDGNWSTDEVNIVNAITERLGLALDNARLFEETTRRASRERLVSDITTKIRSTNDPQEMINTAMQELQRALGATRIEIVPKKTASPPDK